MVIRRIREHVTAHNWFAVAIDLGIVVLGVFLGTQVSNWNEARHDRDKGQAYRVRLVDELRTTEQGMRGIKLYYTDARAHAVGGSAGGPEGTGHEPPAHPPGVQARTVTAYTTVEELLRDRISGALGGWRGGRGGGRHYPAR